MGFTQRRPLLQYSAFLQGITSYLLRNDSVGQASVRSSRITWYPILPLSTFCFSPIKKKKNDRLHSLLAASQRKYCDINGRKAMPWYVSNRAKAHQQKVTRKNLTRQKLTEKKAHPFFFFTDPDKSPALFTFLASRVKHTLS